MLARADNRRQLDDEFDVLVIGGGATGLGVAVDAAARGYRTALLEARDFASGTSSRSTKLVHGGVRYLQQRDVKLVREALHERGLLLRNAPNLVHELRFLVPAYGRWQKAYYGAGLKLYDLLAGRLGLTGAKLVDAQEAVELVPTIERGGLRGGVLYSDGQFNDTRLALALARTAGNLGAALLNYAPVHALLHDGEEGRVSGAVAVDLETGAEFHVRARAVVNATGVFSDNLRKLDDPEAEPMIAVSQGTHLVLDRSFLPGETAIMVPKTDDGRVIFIIPWQGRTLIGTTDTPLGAPAAEPIASAAEIDFVLHHAQRYLDRKPTRADIRAVFAGLRPLVRGDAASTAQLSRDHVILVSGAGLVTVTGGKWTTYRRMAEDAVNRASAIAELPVHPPRTAQLPISGSDSTDPDWRELGASQAEARDFDARFPGRLSPRLPYTLGMAAFVIEREMPVKLDDVLARRLRALFLDVGAAIESAPAVARLMAQLQGRDDGWSAAQVADFTALAQHYRATPVP